MVESEYWRRYAADYRRMEVATIARWLEAGESGAVMGLVGCGRSNLLNFICHRPDALAPYLTRPDAHVLIMADIYNLPSNDLSSLYRTLLHAFSWNVERFQDGALQQDILRLYQENSDKLDPFQPQMALFDLMRACEQRGLQIVLVLNRFDRFCAKATDHMISSLRGLRDMFRGTLQFIAGMSQFLAYVDGPLSLGDVHDLLVTRLCWVGALNDADAATMIQDHFPAGLPEADKDQIGQLSGRYPSLLKAVCQWRQQVEAPGGNWVQALLAERSVQFRLGRIWQGLTQEERLALMELQKLQLELGRPGPAGTMAPPAARRHARLENDSGEILAGLAQRGLLAPAGKHWQIASELLVYYLVSTGSLTGGRLKLDPSSRILTAGRRKISDLTDMEFRILQYLFANPQARLSSTDIIENVWQSVTDIEYVDPNALQVHIANIRRKIEPLPHQPKHIVTWRGNPGGYQFFPEGKPGK
ncbi:MAG: response regulator transcription factor [Anaerolineales bacterium]|nr:response regulator transcription factor [Anaerolineales bacterium]MCB0010987.1 response regulator transcription factor [Anaerolineales bacterium]